MLMLDNSKVSCYSIRQFELVKALATYRHFGRAAAALRISQPAVTRSLKHLEDLLGVPLFDRQGVTPTAVFGELVLSHGEPVIKGFADLMREIDFAGGRAWKSASSASLRAPIPPIFRPTRDGHIFRAASPALCRAEALQLDENRQPGVERAHRPRLCRPLRGGRRPGTANRGRPNLPVEFLLRRQASVGWAQQRDARGICAFPWVGPTVTDRMRRFLPQGDLPAACLTRRRIASCRES